MFTTTLFENFLKRAFAFPPCFYSVWPAGVLNIPDKLLFILYIDIICMNIIIKDFMNLAISVNRILFVETKGGVGAGGWWRNLKIFWGSIMRVKF